LTGHVRRHAVLLQFLYAGLDVEAHLIVEIPVKLGATAQISRAAE
jgi:hypothetical protein